jgi:hypothetical protein
MDIGLNFPPAYPASGPVYNGLHTEPWIADDEVLFDVRTRLTEHITSAPSVLKLDTRNEENFGWWRTEYAGLADASYDTLGFLYGVGTLLGGIVPQRLKSFHDPWRKEPPKSRIRAS